MKGLNLSARDIDALSRIAYAEARSIAARTGDTKSAYGSVVDAILNRMAVDRSYMGGNVLSNVIDKSAKNKAGDTIYQFTPVAKYGSWENMPRAPKAVESAVRSHLRDLQTGKANIVGDATHYLNPHAPRTEHAKNTWAKDWESWPQVGAGAVQHRFGNADKLDVPDYSVSFQPPVGFPAPPVPQDMSPEAQYAYAGLTRSLAPSQPVDREFHTPESVHARAAETMGSQGILGLDGRGGNFSAPLAPVERGGSLAPARSAADMALANAYSAYGASRAAGARAGQGQPAMAVTPEQRNAIAGTGPYGPGGLQITEQYRPDAFVVDPDTTEAVPNPNAALSVPQLSKGKQAGKSAPDMPAQPPSRASRAGERVGKVGKALDGTPAGFLLGKVSEMLERAGRAPSKQNGKPTSKADGLLASLFGPAPAATPFSVGTGLDAIMSVLGGAAPGATAQSASHPGASWSVNDNGFAEFTSQHGFTGRAPDGF